MRDAPRLWETIAWILALHKDLCQSYLVRLAYQQRYRPIMIPRDAYPTLHENSLYEACEGQLMLQKQSPCSKAADDGRGTAASSIEASSFKMDCELGVAATSSVHRRRDLHCPRRASCMRGARLAWPRWATALIAYGGLRCSRSYDAVLSLASLHLSGGPTRGTV
jgi:hypothetical protein